MARKLLLTMQRLGVEPCRKRSRGVESIMLGVIPGNWVIFATVPTVVKEKNGGISQVLIETCRCGAFIVRLRDDKGLMVNASDIFDGKSSKVFDDIRAIEIVIHKIVGSQIVVSPVTVETIKPVLQPAVASA